MQSVHNNDLVHALKPSLWATEALGFTPDPWQAHVLDSAAKKILLNCSRQSGKSSVSAILSIHVALFQPCSLVLMVSHSLRQSSELFRKVLRYMELLDDLPSRNEDTKLSLRLDNGSRVVSLPGSEGTIRGYSAVNLLIIDEAARVVDDLYYAVKPMLAVSRGRLLALSTPWGQGGWWHDAWVNGDDWEKHMITAQQCPRISPAFLEEERRSMPRAVFQSEYMCEFTESVDSVFGYDEVMAALYNDAQPLEI
jgi:hypothetical protein